MPETDSIRQPQVEDEATDIIRGAKLDLIDVQKRYVEREVLHGVNLHVEPGEAIAIVGRSGCGKSTLLRLISGLESPTSGSILVNENPVRGINRSACVMFQDSNLVPWKRVGANVELAMLSDRSRRARAMEELDRVGLANRAHDWPGDLSGGQRQRVALARALAARREILLLDEPLSALDALTRFEMQQLIERLWRQKRFTLILVTHDVEEALAIADRVLVMDEGLWKLEIPVALPRPRVRTDSAFNRLKEYLLGAIVGRNEDNVELSRLPRTPGEG